MSDGPDNEVTRHDELVEPPSWGLAEVAVGFGLMITLSILASIIYGSFAEPGQSRSIPGLLAGFSGIWISFFAVPFFVSRNRPGGLPQQMGLRFSLPGDLIRGLGVGFLGQLLVALVYIPVSILDPDLAKSVSEPAKDITSSIHGWRWALMALFVGFLAPFFEELFFRGLTLRAITAKWGPIAGVLGSAGLFGLVHLQGIQTPALIVLGILLGIRAHKTGRIGETMVAHGTFNLITLGVLFLNR